MRIESAWGTTPHEAVKVAMNYAETLGREVDVSSFRVTAQDHKGVFVSYRTYQGEHTPDIMELL